MDVQSHLAALEVELEQAQRARPGGQQPRPDRVAAIREQIAHYRHLAAKAADAPETTQHSAPSETADVPRAGRQRKQAPPVAIDEEVEAAE